MRDMKSSLIPLIEELSEGISSQACTVSPIAGLNYIHQRKEQKRKSDAVEISKNSNLINNRKSSPLKRIESRRVLKDVSNIVPVPKSRASLPRTKKMKMSLPTLKSRIPEPEDGLEYKPLELINIAKNTDRSISRGRLIKYTIDNKLIPVNRAAAFRLLQRHEAGEVVRNEWRKVGRNRMMDDTEVKRIVDDLTLYSGKTISNEEIKEQLKQAQVKRIKDQGRVPLTNGIDPCKATIINYKGLISSTNGVSMCTNTTPKTRTRYTAENSLISAMALLCVIATTHYDVASCEKEFEIEKLVRHNNVPDGVSLLYKLISKAYGKNVPLIPVEPSRITSTDDTTNYIYEGRSGGDEGNFRLVASQALENAGTRSKFKIDETKKMCGMRVKLTYTFSAAGIIAPLFISVVGL